MIRTARAVQAMAILLLTASAAPIAAETAVSPDMFGIWTNPRGTVKVQTRDCDGRLCGHIVWAAPEAVADARESGVPQLIGVQLLRDYRAIEAGRWQGQVYVPDMGRSFSSTIRRINANSLKISGCVLGGWICKSQVWQRD